MARVTDTSSRRPRLARGPGFWVIAAAFLTVMAFATVPTPLYALYERRDGFPTWVVTVVFAVFAVGVLASLFLIGHISDWAGRRRMILIAIAIELVSAAIFLLSDDLPALLVARFICGVGVGTLTAAATAHLSELAPTGSARAGAVPTAVNIGGASSGTGEPQVSPP